MIERFDENNDSINDILFNVDLAKLGVSNDDLAHVVAVNWEKWDNSVLVCNKRPVITPIDTSVT